MYGDAEKKVKKQKILFVIKFPVMVRASIKDIISNEIIRKWIFYKSIKREIFNMSIEREIFNRSIMRKIFNKVVIIIIVDFFDGAVMKTTLVSAKIVSNQCYPHHKKESVIYFYQFTNQ